MWPAAALQIKGFPFSYSFSNDCKIHEDYAVLSLLASPPPLKEIECLSITQAVLKFHM